MIAMTMGLAFAAAAATQQPTGRLEVDVTGLRNAEGWVRVCLMTTARGFPDCTKDPRARKLNLRADQGRRLVFDGLAPGAYALTLLHDENGNGRMDYGLGMPREGFAFSNDAPARLGPAKFEAARFSVGPGLTRTRVKVRYWL